jgi:predicted AAA+ superfamily ATPase
MKIKRLVDLAKFSQSVLLLGPRMTGKTSLLADATAALTFDLLDLETELTLRSQPAQFLERIKILPQGSTVIVDEVQKIPELLNYIQIGIEKYGLRFILSGSSARKLKRGYANLLGGRALDFRLHPLTHVEIGADFDIGLALRFGTIPKIYLLAKAGNELEARLVLSSYYSTYLKEEVQAEALVRNLSGFHRFLPVAASCDAREIAYSNVARDAQLSDSTVKDYFSILEDTLIARFVWAWNSSERKKSHPKFYMFDPGVTRALLNRLVDPPSTGELGYLFESWFVNELHRLRDYYFKTDQLSYWKDGANEVDIIVHSKDKFRLAIEIKSGEIHPSDLRGINAFKERFPNVPSVVASLKDSQERIVGDGIKVLPWKAALDMAFDLMS